MTARRRCRLVQLAPVRLEPGPEKVKAQSHIQLPATRGHDWTAWRDGGFSVKPNATFLRKERDCRDVGSYGQLLPHFRKSGRIGTN